MYYRLTQLLILGYYIILFTEPVFTLNLTSTNKLLCYSCKGSNCETISNDEDNVIICNKYTQLCWAGFIDEQPYRTCASRYCTPNDISLDSDIRIETCCHSNLCNSISLSWSIWNKWYRKSSTHRPDTSIVRTTETATRRTTIKRISTTPRIYIVNEIVNDERKPSYRENNEEQDDSYLTKLQLNASDPASFGINWDRIPYDKDFSNRVASISKLLILIMPVLLVLLF